LYFCNPMKHRKATSLLIYIVFFTLSGILSGSKLAAQQARYNRFQYHKYNWRLLTTGSFHLYFPSGYDSLCRFASLHLPDIAVTVRKATGMEPDKIPNVVIYPSADQLYESNIGLYEQSLQTFPTINLKGNRVVVAFTGSYEDFRRELTEAWVRLSWNETFKADLGEQLAGTQALMLGWFKEGCIRYFAEGWPVTAEDKVRDYMSKGCNDADSFIITDPALYGQAFCYFLSIRYRKDAARQVTAQLRQGKSLRRAVRLVAKQPLDTLHRQCMAFYRRRCSFFSDAADAAKQPDTLAQKTAGKATVLGSCYSPDEKYIAFVTDNGFKRSVYILPVAGSTTGHSIRPVVTYSLPPWIDDLAKDIYPVISWESNSHYLLIALPEKGKIKIRRYTAEGTPADSRILYGVDGVSNIYNWRQNTWIMAAFRRAQGDIVLYNTGRSAYTPLTNDLADNTGLTIDNRRLKIAYRSGYPADSIVVADSVAKDYGIYEKSINDVGHTAKQADEPVALDSAYITWTSPVFNNENDLTAVQTASGTQVRQRIRDRNAGDLYADPAPWLNDYTRIKKEQDSIARLKQKLQEDNITLLGNILEPGNTAGAAKMQEDSIRRAVAYHPKKIKPYIMQLYSAYFSASINNDYYINRYQPYKAYLGSFKFPEVGAMVQGGFSDLFDNHHFNIGYRMPSGTDGSDFFFRYGNTARKLDWHIMYFRKVETLDPDPDRNWLDKEGLPYPALAKVKTYYYELGFHYPLHYDWSLSLDIAARNDKTIFPATDRHSLQYDNLHQWWNINSLILHADKLHPVIPMLYKGWEGKVMLDGMLAHGENAVILYGSMLKVAFHQPLYKKITAVLQLQAGYSGGAQKILYNFGGLDNNVVPRIDTTVQLKQDAPYAFQSLVTPFRGYRQNSIYGSRFGLINADIYVPLFAGLIPWHTSFSMVNQLQLGIFCDAAFAGRDENMLPETPAQLFAYGLSARTMLAGYGLRFDIAWPGSFNKQPVWYLSLLL